MIRALGRIPRVGPSLESLINAVRMYSSKPLTLTISTILTVGVHCLFAAGCFLIACGLPGDHLSLADHFVVVLLSSATGVLPLPMGPFEAVLEFFYMNVPAAPLHIAAGQGLLVALVYRLITLLIASLGIFYYLGNRRRVVRGDPRSESGRAGRADGLDIGFRESTDWRADVAAFRGVVKRFDR